MPLTINREQKRKNKIRDGIWLSENATDLTQNSIDCIFFSVIPSPTENLEITESYCSLGDLVLHLYLTQEYHFKVAFPTDLAINLCIYSLDGDFRNHQMIQVENIAKHVAPSSGQFVKNV